MGNNYENSMFQIKQDSKDLNPRPLTNAPKTFNLKLLKLKSDARTLNSTM